MELVSIESSLYFWTKKEERTILFLSHRPFVPFLNRWMDIARRLLVGNMTARVRFESAEEARHFNPDSDPVLWLRDGSGSGSGRGGGIDAKTSGASRRWAASLETREYRSLSVSGIAG